MNKYELAKKLMAEEAPKRIFEALQKGECPNGWDLVSYSQAGDIAEQLTRDTGKLHLPCDYGDARRPQFEVVKVPVVGEPCSKGFNGDRYPCGYIKSVSASGRVVVTDGGLKFYRRGKTAAWVQEGGTWGLIQGHVSTYNREF